jgi:hypothetical protein
MTIFSSSVCRILFKIFCSPALMAMYCFSFCLSQKVFISKRKGRNQTISIYNDMMILHLKRPKKLHQKMPRLQKHLH